MYSYSFTLYPKEVVCIIDHTIESPYFRPLRESPRRGYSNTVKSSTRTTVHIVIRVNAAVWIAAAQCHHKRVLFIYTFIGNQSHWITLRYHSLLLLFSKSLFLVEDTVVGSYLWLINIKRRLSCKNFELYQLVDRVLSDFHQQSFWKIFLVSKDLFNTRVGTELLLLKKLKLRINSLHRLVLLASKVFPRVIFLC